VDSALRTPTPKRERQGRDFTRIRLGSRSKTRDFAIGDNTRRQISGLSDMPVSLVQHPVLAARSSCRRWSPVLLVPFAMVSMDEPPKLELPLAGAVMVDAVYFLFRA